MQLLTKCLIWLQRRTLKAKLESGNVLTFSESLAAISDPTLAGLIATRHHPVVVQLPPNVVIRGADNIVFENNVRIHSEENMAITTRQILTINDPTLKQDSFISREQLDGNFETRLKAIEANMKMIENQQRQKLTLENLCEHTHHKKENKHASSGKAGRQIQGTPKSRTHDSGKRKSRHAGKWKSTTPKG
jgi:hypothetical protein